MTAKPRDLMSHSDSCSRHEEENFLKNCYDLELVVLGAFVETVDSKGSQSWVNSDGVCGSNPDRQIRQRHQDPLYENLVDVIYHRFVKVDGSMGNLQARVSLATRHRGEPAASIAGRRQQQRHYGDLRRFGSAMCNHIRFAAYPQDDLTTTSVRYDRHASLRVIPIVVRHLQPLSPCSIRSLMSKLNLDIIAAIRPFGAIKECNGGFLI